MIERKFLPSAVVAAQGLGDRQIKVIASTATPDRVGDIMKAEGADLANFRRNPIVLANHDPTKPIGTASCEVKDGRVEALITFAPAGISEKADEYCGLTKSGVLQSVSVGFRPIDAAPRKGGGLTFNKWELVELSVVSIPANPEALVVGRSLNDARARRRAVDVLALASAPHQVDAKREKRLRAVEVLKLAGAP
ncbi:HK97 family phage prohead protease [Terrarubrum flagellatum]|uniref:HK97 family phage prohead protease n=1 Tax=Terrirubrum flagellatum TaxID=2895980 RepID=UPI003144FFEC